MENVLAVLNQKPTAQQDVEWILQAMCRDASENVDADLVSIWVFNASYTKIICKMGYDADTGNYSSGPVLERFDYPIYFRNIVQEISISAPDVTVHLGLSELIKSYFEPQNIVSLLDFVIYRKNQPKAVICCENRACLRDWSEEDINYIRSLTTIAGFHFDIFDE